MSNEEQIMSILQEECAEVIQAVSKVRRFGKENNMEELCKEIADVEVMISLAKEYINELYRFDWGKARQNKIDKLHVYSTIFLPEEENV